MVVQRIHLRRCISELSELPTSRGALHRIVELLGGEVSPVRERISEGIFADLGLGAELLRSHNQVTLYELVGVPTAHEIVTQLGIMQVRRLVAGKILNHSIQPKDLSGGSENDFASSSLENQLEVFANEVRTHALTVAVCAKNLVYRVPRFFGKDKSFGSKVYLAGLLHDIGKLALIAIVRNNPDLQDLFMEIKEPVQWGALEEKLVPHYLAGKWLAEDWNFHKALVEVIAYHHLPEDAYPSDKDTETYQILNVLRGAHCLANLLEVEKTPGTMSNDSQLLKLTGLEEDKLDELRDVSRAAVSSLTTAYFSGQVSEKIPLSFIKDVLNLDNQTMMAYEGQVRKAKRLRSIHRLMLARRKLKTVFDVHRYIVNHLREEWRLAPCICSIADNNAKQLLLQVWKTLSESPQQFVIPYELNAEDSTHITLLHALETLGLGISKTHPSASPIEGITNWGGIVAIPMLVSGICYGQIVFDTTNTQSPLTEEFFEDLLALGTACGMLVMQQQQTERFIHEAEKYLEYVEREQELQSRLRSLEKLAAIGENSAQAIQALNTPLSIANAQLQWFLNRAADEKTRRTLANIIRHTRTAYRMTKDILLLANPPGLRTEPTLLNFLLHNAVTELAEILVEKAPNIAEEYADGLPRIHADRRLLEHALVNLLHQCTENFQGTESRIVIQTWAAPDRQTVFARIARHGQAQKSIFSDDFSLHGWRTELGVVTPEHLRVSVARDIIESHGGKIEVETIPEMGIAITLQFPAVIRSVTSPIYPSRPPKSEKRTCLVVEDDANFREVLRQALATLNLEAMTASDGVEALALLQTNTFDLIISDIRMPNMDGITLLQRIRSKDKRVPIIIMTGAVEENILEKAKAAGATTCISKPFHLRELRERIQQILGAVGSSIT